MCHFSPSFSMITFHFLHEIRQWCLSVNTHLLTPFKGAYSLHTIFLELVRMIKYRVPIGKWNIYYYDVVLMGCPRYILTLYFLGLPQICGLQVWHNWPNIGTIHNANCQYTQYKYAGMRQWRNGHLSQVCGVLILPVAINCRTFLNDTSLTIICLWWF